MLYPIAIQVAAMLALWLLLCTWSRDRHAAAGPWFIGMVITLLLWCAGEVLLNLGAVGPIGRDRISFLGILAAPALWLGVAAHAGGTDFARRVPWFPLVLLAPSAVLYSLLWMGPLSSAFVISDGAVGEEGPLFVPWVLWAFLLIAAGVVGFVLAVSRWPRKGLGWRLVALMIAVALPTLANAIHVLSPGTFERDPTPLMMALAALPMRRAVFGSRFFEVLPVDQREIVRGLPVAVVLADATGTVVQLNRCAEELLSSRRAQIIGRSLDAVLQMLPSGVGSRVADAPGGAVCAVLGVTENR